MWDAARWNGVDDLTSNLSDARGDARSHAVIHRSLPSGYKRPRFIDVRGVVRALEKHKVCDVRLVVTTRDRELALRSKLRHHQPERAVAAREQRAAAALLSGVLASPPGPPAPTFVWSHEAFTMLREPYAQALVDFVLADLPASSHGTPLPPPPPPLPDHRHDLPPPPPLTPPNGAPVKRSVLLPPEVDSNAPYTRESAFGMLASLVAQHLARGRVPELLS